MGRYTSKLQLAVGTTLAILCICSYNGLFSFSDNRSTKSSSSGIDNNNNKNIIIKNSKKEITHTESPSIDKESLKPPRESEFVLRSRRMHNVCGAFPEKRQILIPLNGRLLYISEKYKLSYCRVAKVGSTFWTQIFMELAGVKPQYDELGEIKSVFDIPRIETHKTIREHSDLTMAFNDTRLNKTTSFLVARNPYSRLFSSYIDQVFLPTKWKNAGKMKKDKKRSHCGNDVTFEEFLVFLSSYILQGIDVDLHWAPIFSICMPCQYKVNYLAKQETFTADAEEILGMVGVPNSVIDKVRLASTEHLIDSSIHPILHHYIIRGHQAQAGCLTETELAQKLWTAFQIQGYIHNDNKFPAAIFKNVNANNTEKVLLNAIIKAGEKKSLTSEERSRQRNNWKLWFWKNVTKDTVKLVQSAFFEDFHVFDYDMDINKM